MKERDVIGQRRRFEPNQNSNGPRQQSRRNFANPQHHRTYAANVQNPPRSDIRCFECNELGHYRNRCPHLAHRAAVAAESSPRRPGGRNTGRGRGRGRAARIFGRDQRRNAHAHAAFRNPTLGEGHERATIYAAIDNRRAQHQFTVIHTPATHQGKDFNFLIDCGSTHSFLSPKCLRKLQLNQQSDKPMLVELANGKTVISRHSVRTLEFELGEHSTSAFFRTLLVGVYDGILGMDWLSRNQMNKVDPEINTSKPTWLEEYADIFSEDLTDLPPTREIDHEIEILPGSEHVSKRPYKMSLPEAIELKE
ncbi:hypothetical protein L7F22_065251 [Adiantum nelumboides]|nr:hypothetical protein [Adiantum nelumboides]